jgi:hypothetical protein
VAVEVAVSAAVVDAAAEVVEVEDVEVATTVTKMATLLENVLRDVTMEVTITAIRHENKSTRDSNHQKQPEKSRKKTKHESPRFLSCQSRIVLCSIPTTIIKCV